jgi:hypothetical protein
VYADKLMHKRRLGWNAYGAVLVLVASGCQLITGSYTADGIDAGGDAGKTGDATPPGLGPNCMELARCCGSLDSAQSMVCLSAVGKEDESVCAATLTGFSSACMKAPDGGSPDGTRPDGPSGDGVASDVVMNHHDGSGSKDVSVPSDAAIALEGTWTLTEVTCEGTPLTLAGGTTTLTFSTGSVTELENLTDGCVITIDLTSVSISKTDINAAAGTVACGTECTTDDDCTAGDTGSVDLPYTLSGGTLQISQSADTTECSSGTVVFVFTM